MQLNSLVPVAIVVAVKRELGKQEWRCSTSVVDNLKTQTFFKLASELVATPLKASCYLFDVSAR